MNLLSYEPVVQYCPLKTELSIAFDESPALKQVFQDYVNRLSYFHNSRNEKFNDKWIS